MYTYSTIRVAGYSEFFFFLTKIAFASRFPPRRLEAPRLRSLEKLIRKVLDGLMLDFTQALFRSQFRVCLASLWASECDIGAVWDHSGFNFGRGG